MSKEIIVLQTQELELIEKSKAEQIKAVFNPMVKMLEELEDRYNKVILDAKESITVDTTATAKRLRLDIGKIRIETGKIKDKQKEYIKLEDKAIMGVHNILVWAVKEKEDKLKAIEDHFELLEKKRLEDLQLERVAELSKYIEDANERDLSSMDDEVWNAYISTKKKEYLDRVEAERIAEKERIAKEKAEKEEQERIRKENEKLKKEAIERERLAKIEQDKREKEEKERKAKEESERKVREQKEAKEKAEREAKEKKEREEYEAKLKAEREEKERIQKEERLKREKLEAELKAKEEERLRLEKLKEESERKAREQEEKRIQDELNKGDVAKVKDLISDLEILKTKYSFKSLKNKEMYNEAIIGIGNVIYDIKQWSKK